MSILDEAEVVAQRRDDDAALLEWLNSAPIPALPKDPAEWVEGCGSGRKVVVPCLPEWKSVAQKLTEVRSHASQGFLQRYRGALEDVQRDVAKAIEFAAAATMSLFEACVEEEIDHVTAFISGTASEEGKAAASRALKDLLAIAPAAAVPADLGFMERALADSGSSRSSSEAHAAHAEKIQFFLTGMTAIVEGGLDSSMDTGKVQALLSCLDPLEREIRERVRRSCTLDFGLWTLGSGKSVVVISFVSESRAAQRHI